jgi:hypothetical protein
MGINVQFSQKCNATPAHKRDIIFACINYLSISEAGMTHRLFSFRLLPLALPLMLGGCGLTEWADKNMPVIGQRCENWQCFTSSGQEQSKINHEERIREESGPRTPIEGNPAAAYAQQPAPAPQHYANTPAGGAYATPDPMAPGMQPVPTNIYVPRAAPPPGTTPFDGNIQPLPDNN